MGKFARPETTYKQQVSTTKQRAKVQAVGLTAGLKLTKKDCKHALALLTAAKKEKTKEKEEKAVRLELACCRLQKKLTQEYNVNSFVGFQTTIEFKAIVQNFKVNRQILQRAYVRYLKSGTSASAKGGRT